MRNWRTSRDRLAPKARRTETSLLPRSGASHQQVCHVGACDEQNETDRCQENIKRRCEILTKLRQSFASGCQNNEAILDLAPPFGGDLAADFFIDETAQQGADVGLCLLQGSVRLEATHDVKPVGALRRQKGLLLTHLGLSGERQPHVGRVGL